MESEGMTGKKAGITPTRDQLEASDPERTIWVSANAGSGKTHVLVDRVIRLMLGGAEPDTILCLTFTKAAASEMKNRLFQHLSQWTLASDDELKKDLQKLEISTSGSVLMSARQLFTKALETPGGLKIQTIHAFAEKLLQLFPVEAGIAPGFKVMDDRETEDLIRAARSDIMSKAQTNDDSDLAGALAMVSEYASGSTFEALLSAVFANREVTQSLLGSENEYPSIRAAVAQTLGINARENRGQVLRELLKIDGEAYLAAAHETRGIVPFGTGKFMLSKSLMAVSLSVSSEERLNSLRELYFKKDNDPRDKFYKNDFIPKFQRVADWLQEEKARVTDQIMTHDLHLRADMTASLLYLAQSIAKDFDRRKRAASMFDFADLIDRASQLLRDSPMTQWVLNKLDRGITHILVDEAQDTSPDQWKIILAIADEFFAGKGVEQKVKRTLFVVGDQKQSIFSFQGADAKAFQEVRNEVTKRVKSLDKKSPQISLLTSYRSVPEVLDFVDAVFPDEAAAALGLDPTDDERRKHESNRMTENGLVQFWPLIGNTETSEPDHWLVPTDRPPAGFHRSSLARKIAFTVKNWIGRRNIPSLGRTVTAGDILILLQSRGQLFSMIIAELRALGIDVAGADRIKLMESLAVQDLLAFAQVMLLPDDDYSLACILKSPFVPVPLTDDDLMELSLERKGQSLLSRLLAARNIKSVTNADFIEGFRKEASLLGPFSFFSKLLSLRRKEMQLRLGPEARDATNALLDVAIDYEYEHDTSLSGFVAWFQSGETVLKREMQKPVNQVRLMTVHGAKGLESEIVFIPDAADEKNRRDVSLVYAPTGLPVWAIGDLAQSSLIDQWRDTKKRMALEEHKRLLYVAMTRAKDELYIAGSRSSLQAKDGKDKEFKDTWYHFIQIQIAGQQKVQMEQIEDPWSGGTAEHFGASPTSAIRTAETPAVASALPSWLLKPVALPPVPTSWSVTRLASEIAPTPESQKGLSFGIKVHEFFRLMPQGDTTLRLSYAAEVAKRLELDPGFLRNLTLRIEEPDLAPFFGSQSMAEVEILASLPSGQDMSGRVDRLRITDDHIYLLDYKTDTNPPPMLTADLHAVQQIALYCNSVVTAYPGRDAKVGVFWTASRHLDLLSTSLVTQACDLALLLPEQFLP
jgi:ATP-dependent helicase/nuclease subunit A